MPVGVSNPAGTLVDGRCDCEPVSAQVGIPSGGSLPSSALADGYSDEPVEQQRRADRECTNFARLALDGEWE